MYDNIHCSFGCRKQSETNTYQQKTGEGFVTPIKIKFCIL